MTYQQTLDYLFSRLPMFSRVGSIAFKKDLTNTLSLCEYFDNPHRKFQSIHIGGTNGKGSTTNFLGSSLVEAGLKVGIYTSPHLIDFRERIKIGNEYISEQFIIDFVEKAKPIIEKIEPSFFELTVVMAFEYFAKQNVDIALIEVGLGGRLDSTNVISPILSIITNISLDHTNMLGNTVESIAIEKAGIIKPNSPIVIGEFDDRTMPIFEAKANLENAFLTCADLTIKNEDISIKILDSMPSYQVKNLKTVLQAIRIIDSQHLISNLNINLESKFEIGVENMSFNTRFAGRWTRLNFKNKSIILECAHNEAGIEEMKLNLSKEKYSKAYILYGTVNDKDLTKIISILPNQENIQYILTKADIPRALSIDDLESLFIQSNISNYIKEIHAKLAIENAIELSQKEDLILVTGSIFLVGDVLGILNDLSSTE